jgi:hypothetical protein
VSVSLELLDKTGIACAQEAVIKGHYLHAPVDPRCSVEGYRVVLENRLTAGFLLFGRTEATRCGEWYGDWEDVLARRCEVARGCEVTRWQVLNLARVYLYPDFQYGGKHYSIDLPGYLDRKSIFRSTLASTVLKLAVKQIGFDYLIQRPPCFLNEPYQIDWLLSYCNTALHRGTIYKNAGFELYRTNQKGIQTWRIRLPALTQQQREMVIASSLANPRAIRYRSQRKQMQFSWSHT